jgi:hypothetical protein
MKINPIFSVIVFLAALSSCATSTVERRVENNMFASSYPDMRIAVSPSFQYLGNIVEKKEVPSSQPGRTLRVDSDAYIFIKPYPGQPRLQNILTIEIEKIESFWMSDIFFLIQNKLDTGSLTLGDSSFIYCTWYTTPGSDSHLTRFVHEKGYFIPAGLYKEAARLHGVRGDTKVRIMYLEDMGEGDLSKMNWKTKVGLDARQREYLEAFNERFMSAFRSFKSGEVPEMKK